MATLPGAGRYRVSGGTGRPGVSKLWLGEMESWICNFYLSVAARKMVCADPSLRYTGMLLGRLSSQQANPPPPPPLLPPAFLCEVARAHPSCSLSFCHFLFLKKKWNVCLPVCLSVSVLHLSMTTRLSYGACVWVCIGASTTVSCWRCQCILLSYLEPAVTFKSILLLFFFLISFFIFYLPPRWPSG